MKVLKIKREHLLQYIFFLIMILVFIYMGLQKTGFHIDEVYTYGLSNSYFEPFPWNKPNDWLSTSYYYDYLMPTSGDRFAYDSVVYNQIQDVHPPFYYLIIHTLSSLWPAGFSKWIGLSANAAFHVLTGVFLYKSLRLLKFKSIPATLLVAVWAFSKGGLDSYSYIRMYSLLGLLQMALSYYSLEYVSKEKDYRALIFIFLTIYLSGLTHYYFYIYGFFLIACISLSLLFMKNYKKMLSYAITSLFAVVAAFVSFPAVKEHVFETNRGTEVLENSKLSFDWESLKEFFSFVSEDLLANQLGLILGLLALGLLLTLIFRKRTEISIENDRALSLGILLAIVVTLFITTVSQVSHYKTSRYIFSVYPIIILSLGLILKAVKEYLFGHKQRIVSGLFWVILVCLTVFGNFKGDYLYHYPEYQPLYHALEQSDVKRAIVFSDKYWKTSNLVPDFLYFDEVYSYFEDQSEQSIQEINFNGGNLTVFLSNDLADKKAFREWKETNKLGSPTTIGFHKDYQVIEYIVEEVN